MSLSSDAARYLDALAVKYHEHRPPNHRVWKFDKGQEDAVHDELQQINFIQRLGAKGAAWILTDLGVLWIKERSASATQRREGGIVSTTLDEKQRNRFQLLKTIYEMTDGNSGHHAIAEDLREASGLAGDAFDAAERYLTGEGLIEGATLSSLSLSHAGVVEYESALAAADGRGRESHYFPNSIVHAVINQHFHAAVGAVQTGAGAVANVQQSIRTDVRELVDLLGEVESELRADTSEQADAAKSFLVVVKDELATSEPNWGSVKSILQATDKAGQWHSESALDGVLEETLGTLKRRAKAKSPSPAPLRPRRPGDRPLGDSGVLRTARKTSAVSQFDRNRSG